MRSPFLFVVAYQANFSVARIVPASSLFTVTFAAPPLSDRTIHSNRFWLSVISRDEYHPLYILLVRPSSCPASWSALPLRIVAPSGSSSLTSIGRTALRSWARLLVYVGRKPVLLTTTLILYVPSPTASTLLLSSSRRDDIRACANVNVECFSHISGRYSAGAFCHAYL